MRWGGVLAIILGLIVYVVISRIQENLKKPSVSLDDMPDEIKLWRAMGNTVRINGREMFYIKKKCTNPNIERPPIFAIIHGFPSSSYEYHKVLNNLADHGHVIVNDHIGFGFSEAPTENYTYSLGEAAENILALWRHLRIKKVHVIAHDMGDSILTEILARRHRQMLPSYFDNFFASVTFTNGGMRFDMINFRLSQSLLMYPAIGKPLTAIGHALGLSKPVFIKQVSSIWSPSYSNLEERQRDIEHLYLIHAYNGKLLYGYKSIYYLWDRYNFEFRWFDALRQLDIPCRFIWGDSDDVSPLAIPESFRNMVPTYKLSVVKGAGHFWMMEYPDRWVEEIIKVLQ